MTLRAAPWLACTAVTLHASVAAAQSEEASRMTARTDATTGHVVLAEGDAPVLQYNARTIDPPPGYLGSVHPDNLRYALPRGGYIHPLCGPDGEELTFDWSVDHPHHRGIYWAWPEVQFDGQTRDLHALQGVYSRAVGEPRTSESDDEARIEADNIWLWDDVTPIVFERVAITAHAAGKDGVRAIDLDLRFEALAEGVTLARRGTDLYGGLNTRLAPIQGLELGRHADDESVQPRRAWSWAKGIWKDGKREVTLAILEHPDNPDFPGDWITYEYLPWFQPAFPRAGTRFRLEPGTRLVLRYRYLVVADLAEDSVLADAFETYAATDCTWRADAPSNVTEEEH